MTERTFSPVKLADVREGDTIRISKGDAVVVAPVRNHSRYGLYVDVPGMSVSSDAVELAEMADADGITLERADPALPTEPGFYRGRDWSDGAPALGYHLNARGEWRVLWSMGAPELQPPILSDLPLIRLTKETER
ncbi:hypothetical protein J2Y69_003368 [Microbacterium resistens]|uniref:Uncharacterized protein n=1 Tax=Microbacterium resistens TaxID=156977 RepID=A0ABU1SGS8_9MICO|nr:hypothetical protein [Microbacterium resistens]MDR6868744.1 hypothetical protein [Microbacterium resistens]